MHQGFRRKLDIFSTDNTLQYSKGWTEVFTLVKDYFYPNIIIGSTWVSDEPFEVYCNWKLKFGEFSLVVKRNGNSCTYNFNNREYTRSELIAYFKSLIAQIKKKESAENKVKKEANTFKFTVQPPTPVRKALHSLYTKSIAERFYRNYGVDDNHGRYEEFYFEFKKLDSMVVRPCYRIKLYYDKSIVIYRLECNMETKGNQCLMKDIKLVMDLFNQYYR